MRMVPLVLLGALVSPVEARTYYIDTTTQRTLQLGNELQPYKSIVKVEFKRGNRYLIKRGSIIESTIELRGIDEVEIAAYGEGEKPQIVGAASMKYGIFILGSKQIVIRDFELHGFTESCIHLTGAPNYLIDGIECHQSKFGISINTGKFPSPGIIRNSNIHDVRADGIGAWSMNPGATIINNHIYRFGNDGIDVLGSVDAVIKGNDVHESVDSTDIGFRGYHHVGIKAGGNSDAGGGQNIVESNTVWGVSHFGIFNRNAIGNVYRNNLCYENGVNFNFVAKSVASRATVEGNTSRNATYEKGLKYDVFIPPPEDLESADGNRWQDATVNIKTKGHVSDTASYRKAMMPFEQNSTLD